ncbi:HNH endonuclease [Mycobacterium malmoense]|uniref:HNH endonuclease n=1 Tax=Mycobacterium malmoense TaxID=1780 RepID=UPI0008F96D6D|nr:HNH endonuclease signature motif containing protein [Mycobacterium malmoense]OIN81651.1 hypothetical protein BMG05_06525 [Mycobacterium malmoense]
MQQLRADKLTTNPICEWPSCRRPATDVDHIIPLAEGGSRYDWHNLQSLRVSHESVVLWQWRWFVSLAGRLWSPWVRWVLLAGA